MRFLYSIFTLLPAVIALPQARSTSSKAIYFLKNTNTSDANELVSMPIESSGKLGAPVFTSTKGTGGYPITTLSTPAGIFFSDSIVYAAGKYVFTVNSGSNTLAMFMVSADDASHPTLVQTISTMGEFPMSVAYSEMLEIVCALNVGGSGGVACFKVSESGLTFEGPGRPLDSAFNQTEPPTGPSNSGTQIVFDPKSTALWVIIKGDPTTKPITPGTFIEYPISGGKIADTGKTSQIDDIILNFGTTFISESSFLIAAPTFGGAIVTIEDGKPKQTTKVTVDGELAICWSSWNPCTNTGYLYDAGRTNVTAIDLKNGKLLPPLIASTPGNNGTEGGLYDTAILDNYSYSLADPNGVVVLDLKSGKQVQYFNLDPYGTRIDFEGMASYPSYGC